MPRLNAPTQITFLISLVIAIVAWIGSFAAIPYIGGHPSILMTLAYVVLAVGCVMKEFSSIGGVAPRYSRHHGNTGPHDPRQHAPERHTFGHCALLECCLPSRGHRERR